MLNKIAGLRTKKYLKTKENPEHKLKVYILDFAIHPTAYRSGGLLAILIKYQN
jgi:hypothetical protein